MFSLQWLDIDTFWAEFRVDQEVVSSLLHIPITLQKSLFATVHISQTRAYQLLQFYILDGTFDIPLRLFECLSTVNLRNLITK